MKLKQTLTASRRPKRRNCSAYWQKRPPLYVPKDARLVQILLDVYEDVTGKREEAITIGGGTYCRDVEKGLRIDVPAHYFPGDDPNRAPVVNWRSAGQLFYNNWLNYYVYQTTPYNLDTLTE